MTSRTRRIIVAGTTYTEITQLYPFARTLAQTDSYEILALGLVKLEEKDSLSNGARPAQTLRQQLETFTRQKGGHSAVHVAYHPCEEIVKVIGHSRDDVLFMHRSHFLPADKLQAIPCHVILVNRTTIAKIKKILLPIRGGPSAAFTLRVALAFAQTYGAKIALLHVIQQEKMREKKYRRFLSHLQNLPEITRWIDAYGDPARAILRVARVLKPQLIVLGTTARPLPGDSPIGSITARVADEADSTTLIVRARPESMPQPSPVDFTISVVVDKWFAENTFHAHEFKNIQRLVDMKERQGLTISLGLPALNEQKTIGKVIRIVQTAFMQRYPLLDEIVVIDSNSTDRTVEIAQDLGVPVYRHSEILPHYGSYVGKGEALWKSLFVLRGDLIAWIDTDIVNIHPRFVYGVLGPLIKEPSLMYVKGFYQRPLRVNGKLEARGGGRVTELMARPLLNLFYPELSGLVQPLAGEYAGRRQALERVPFFSGYGVETGLLIDLLNRFGLHTIGQVDLEERIQRNQSLFALSKMAYAILQVVMQRVGATHRIELLNTLNASMKLIQYSEEEFRLQVAEIRDRERPPMVSIAEYQTRKHNKNRQFSKRTG